MKAGARRPIGLWLGLAVALASAAGTWLALDGSAQAPAAAAQQPAVATPAAPEHGLRHFDAVPASAATPAAARGPDSLPRAAAPDYPRHSGR